VLRVGLTGGLGSGKSTVAGMFEELGAAVIGADQLGRELMEPGQPVYAAIVQVFGPTVVRADGMLDRRALAELAFQHNRADALNRIVHPAVVAAEEHWMRVVFANDPSRVAIVESALIFEVKQWGTAPGWMERFDKLILVTVPDDMKVARFVTRMMGSETGRDERREALSRDARARIAAQIPDSEKVEHCDYVIDNTCSPEVTREVVARIYRELVLAARTESKMI
jgi:dephospho-CoA kinase